MATANLQVGADELELAPDGKKQPFLADTFWEDYKNYDVPLFAVITAHLDEKERDDL